jgi:uncharacterized membrane protein
VDLPQPYGHPARMLHQSDTVTGELAGIALFAVAIVCEQAHVASPFVLAWSHPGVRKIALSRPIETMLLPVAAITGALLAPFMVIWWVYWVWNIYHFGAQHYGVSRVFGLRVNKWLCVGGTAAIMVGVPLLHIGWWKWVALVAIDFNHWLVDIGLSSRVSRYWWLFLPAVLALGCVGFLWMVPRADHIVTMFMPWVIKARWGVGIAHFLYSRWVWKLSDPQMRATIGKVIFWSNAAQVKDRPA